jgi:hypothetical protein
MCNGLRTNMRLIEQDTLTAGNRSRIATSCVPIPPAISAITGKRPQSQAAAIIGVAVADVARIASLNRVVASG